MRRRGGGVAPVAVAVVLGAVGASDAAVTLEKVADGLSRPVGIVHAGDGSGRLFIVEQTGSIRVFDGARILTQPFLNLGARVSCCGERGLLGLAFHPRYESNGRFFVFYTNRRGSIVVAEYGVSGDPNRGVATAVRTLLTVPHASYPSHNGGQLGFGPDGLLYIGVGDGGGSGDPDNNAQNLGSRLGKLLRIDVDSAVPYGIPEDNPFAGGDTRDDAVWAYGLRNPWRFSFDRKSGDLYVADVGQNCYEEVNYQPRSSRGGQNYGWRIMEGIRCRDPQGVSCSYPPVCSRSGLTAPIISYGHAGACNAITGGYVYRGRRVPELAGRYLFADYCTGALYAARRAGPRWTVTVLRQTGFTISSFGEDEAGELYLASPESGEIFHLIRSAR